MWLFKACMCVVSVCVCMCVYYLEENTQNQVGLGTGKGYFLLYTQPSCSRVFITNFEYVLFLQLKSIKLIKN